MIIELDSRKIRWDNMPNMPGVTSRENTLYQRAPKSFAGEQFGLENTKNNENISKQGNAKHFII